MKHIFSILISVLLSIASFSQSNFEGIVKWKTSFDGATPSTPGSSQLSPKDQAQLSTAITQMESQLNDPKMQDAYKANPSLKASLEQRIQMMKSMQGGGGSTNGMLNGYIIEMKDGNSLTKVDGAMGAGIGDILHIKSTGKTYFLNRTAKTYSVKAPSANNQNQGVTKVTPTTETMQVLNYTCKKYIVTVTRDTAVRTMYMWVTKDITGFDSQSFHALSMSGNSNTATALSSIDGIPLRIETEQRGHKFVMEVIEITKQSLPATDFILPADYKEVTYGQ